MQDTSSRSRHLLREHLSVLLPLVAVLLLCAHLYGQRFPLMATQFDVWFRTDVNHYMHWIQVPGFTYRFFLHPASLLILKPYSVLVGRLLPLDAHLLALYALPVILYNSTCLTLGLHHVRGKLPLFAVVLLALCVSPFLILAPMPESHTMGGVSLLMEAALLWKMLEEPSEDASRRRAIVFWGIAATGFSLSNIVPALLIAFPLWRAVRLTKRQWLSIVGVVAVVGILGVGQFLVRYLAKHEQGDFVSFMLSRFGAWLHLPDTTAIARSVRALVLAQFGVPTPDRCNYTPEVGAPYDGVILKDAWNSFQCLAALCWLGGIALTWRQGNGASAAPYRLFSLSCGLALAWFLLFHLFFASDEAYMFSVHAWPFLFLPGLLALQSALSERRIPVLLLFGVAVALSLLQSILALPALFRLPIF